MSQKTAKKIRKLEAKQVDQSARIAELASQLCALRHRTNDWETAFAAVHNQAALDATAECNAERRRARKAEREVKAWKLNAYLTLLLLVLATAVFLAISAKADSRVEAVDAPETVQIIPEAVEEPENELIEAALLDRAHAIEGCTVTFYCNERYPHICGTGDGIARDGTPALAWATCAVDPDVIPMGSTVLVDLGDGYGLRTLVANDTGVKGNHLDICVESHNFALQLGRRTATVYWCEE